jgi:hypothetical protein
MFMVSAIGVVGEKTRVEWRDYLDTCEGIMEAVVFIRTAMEWGQADSTILYDGGGMLDPGLRMKIPKEWIALSPKEMGVRILKQLHRASKDYRAFNELTIEFDQSQFAAQGKSKKKLAAWAHRLSMLKNECEACLDFVDYFADEIARLEDKVCPSCEMGREIHWEPPM